MLTHDRDWMLVISPADQAIYDRILPAEAPLLDALELIPWESFVPDLEAYYCPDQGQPARTPLIMLKLEFLRYFCHLSDRGVMERCQTDLLYRWFLQVPIGYRMPDPTSLTRFRGRLGPDGFKTVFDRLIACARQQNLVRDRLRLKDATHVLANIAVPTTLGLLAQLRDRMIQAIEKIDPESATGYRIEVERVRIETQDAEDELKLQQRLALVIDILGWIQKHPTPPDQQANPLWKKLQEVGQLGEKIARDYLYPGQGDRTLSIVDPDARRGKHGGFFDGFLVDVMLDADSQLITEVEVLPGNGKEAMDTVHLVTMEQQTHGNQIQQVSVDGIGFHGESLRALEDPDGLAVSVITPPRDFVGNGGFASSEFSPSPDGVGVTCPAGHKSHKGVTKKDKPNTVFFDFSGALCSACRLLSLCHPKMKAGSRIGRRVSKNEYEGEYERAYRKSTTPNYQSVRREHPMIERKLNEVARHQRGRRARYWGQTKVRAQQIMTCFVVNVKRMTRLLKADWCAVGLATA